MNYLYLLTGYSVILLSDTIDDDCRCTGILFLQRTHSFLLPIFIRERTNDAIGQCWYFCCCCLALWNIGLRFTLFLANLDGRAWILRGPTIISSRRLQVNERIKYFILCRILLSVNGIHSLKYFSLLQDDSESMD